MGEGNTFPGHFGSALILFALSAVMALLLLVSAFVVWLSQVMGSLTGALLLVGGIFLLLAVLLYCFSLRDSFRQISSRLETIYEVAHAAQGAYAWLMRTLRQWL